MELGLRDIPFRETWFPPATMRTEQRADGSMIIEPETPLAGFVPSIPAELAARAAAHPDKTYLAQRPRRGEPWIRCSYAQMKSQADAVSQWLLDRQIEPQRCVLILSANSIVHAAIKFGAMGAGVAVCPISASYSQGQDFARLRHVVSLVRPAVVFAERASVAGAALEQVDFGDAVIVTDEPGTIKRPAVATAAVLSTRPGAAVAQRIAALDPNAPSAYMLTSGSTSLPKAVIQTQRMITANIAQGRQVLGRTAGWHEVMLDWLPWSHVSGAYTQMGVLVSGGSLYIDGGRPAPGLFEETLDNIRELQTAFHVNVPLGYALLADALERDPGLTRAFFANLRLALYGGAGLPQALYDRLQRLAVSVTGKRVFFTTGYGATETSSGCMAIYFPTEEVGIGLPMPGLTLKLQALPDDRYEVRLRGPMIMPGYLGDTEATQRAFDAEGFYCTGDAAQWHEPGNVSRGLKFAGRLAENFKLSSGTWVAAGRLRAALLEACAPLLADALICGENQDYIAVLAWPGPKGIASGAELQGQMSEALRRFNTARSLSERVVRMAFLSEPPNANAHEVSDKGTINQRVAIARRQRDVARLYAPTPAPDVIAMDTP